MNQTQTPAAALMACPRVAAADQRWRVAKARREAAADAVARAGCPEYKAHFEQVRKKAAAAEMQAVLAMNAAVAAFNRREKTRAAKAAA